MATTWEYVQFQILFFVWSWNQSYLFSLREYQGDSEEVDVITIHKRRHVKIVDVLDGRVESIGGDVEKTKMLHMGKI